MVEGVVSKGAGQVVGEKADISNKNCPLNGASIR